MTIDPKFVCKHCFGIIIEFGLVWLGFVFAPIIVFRSPLNFQALVYTFLYQTFLYWPKICLKVGFWLDCLFLFGFDSALIFVLRSTLNFPAGADAF